MSSNDSSAEVLKIRHLTHLQMYATILSNLRPMMSLLHLVCFYDVEHVPFYECKQMKCSKLYTDVHSYSSKRNSNK